MDKMTTNKLIIWKIIALFLLVSLIVIIVLYSCGVGWKDKKNVPDNPDYKSILTLWEPESTIIKKLVPYINEITNKNSIDYIPVEDRIAVLTWMELFFVKQIQYILIGICLLIVSWKILIIKAKQNNKI